MKNELLKITAVLCLLFSAGILLAQENLESPINVKENNGGITIPYKQAIWFDGTQFSWGFGGTWNRFADPITIGGSDEPSSTTGLLITAGNDIELDGLSNNPGRVKFLENNISQGQIYCLSNTTTVQSNEDINLSTGAGAFSTARLTVKLDGKIGVGTTAPTGKLDVRGDICVTGIIRYPSDIRFKKEIDNLENATSLITQLEPKTYIFDNQQFETAAFPSEKQYGLLAQDVQEVMPSIVNAAPLIEDDETAYLSIDYMKLIPVLVQAFKEEHAENEALEKELDTLKAQMQVLEQRLSKIEK